MLTGENGLLTQAENAKSKTEVAEAKEEVEMAVLKCIDYTTGRLKPAGEAKEILEEFVGDNGSVADTDGDYPLTVTYKGYTFQVNSNKKVILITGVTLNKSKLQIKVGGEGEELTATKSNDIKEEIVWSIKEDTSGGKIKVSNGQVTIGDATAGMTAKVEAKAGTYSAECLVEVVSALTKIRIVGGNPSKLEIGKTTTLEVETTPSENVEDLKYESSDESIAKVNQNGKITAIAKGIVTITIKGSITTNVSATHTLTVKEPFDLTAVLPKNAVISEFDGECEDIDEGIVIYIMKDADGINGIDEPDWTNKTKMQTTYDQFVWVPVETAYINLSEIYRKYTAPTDEEYTGIQAEYKGTSTAKADILTEMLNDKIKNAVENAKDKSGKQIYPMAIKIDETNYVGVLYEFNDENKVEISPLTKWMPEYVSGSYYREPDTMSSYDNTTNYLNQMNTILGYTSTDEKTKDEYISSEAKFKKRLQKEYNEMVNSVKDNRGFWIGRYETSKMKISPTTNDNVAVIRGTTEGIADTEYHADGTGLCWYKMYAEQSLYSKRASLNKTTSSMIWGSQWDQVMIWMKDVENENKSTDSKKAYYVTNALGMGNYGTNDDSYSERTETGKDDAFKVKNIYDMAGNVWDWILESYNTDFRTVRGGYCSNTGSIYTRADTCSNSNPYKSSTTNGSRLSLYSSPES